MSVQHMVRREDYDKIAGKVKELEIRLGIAELENLRMKKVLDKTFGDGQ